MEEFEIRSYGVSMSNLEDVFLKINQEFAPDLFGDLKGFDASRSSSEGDSPSPTSKRNSRKTYDRDIAHTMSDGRSPD